MRAEIIFFRLTILLAFLSLGTFGPYSAYCFYMEHEGEMVQARVRKEIDDENAHHCERAIAWEKSRPSQIATTSSEPADKNPYSHFFDDLDKVKVEDLEACKNGTNRPTEYYQSREYQLAGTQVIEYQDQAQFALLIALGVPAALFFIFYCAKWVLTGRILPLRSR